MPAKYEYRIYDYGVPIWIGKYRNLRNLPHWHLEHEIIVCRDGQATVTVDGQHLTLGPGSCVFCCGGSVHYIDADPNCLLTIALFDPEFVKSFADKQILKNPLYPDRYHTGARLLEIENEIAKQSSFYVEKSKTLLINLLIDIFRGEELAPGRVQNSPTLERYKALLEKLDEEYRDITFQQAADFMNMSAAYFSRFFKQMVGRTFSQHLNLIRIDYALKLLSEQPDISMRTLMCECGFNTLRNFNRVFKDVTGYSPRNLPPDYSLNLRSMSTKDTMFNPTLECSIPF